MAELIAIEGGGAPDEGPFDPNEWFECPPTFIGLRQWEADAWQRRVDIADRRSRFRIGEDEG